MLSSLWSCCSRDRGDDLGSNGDHCQVRGATQQTAPRRWRCKIVGLSPWYLAGSGYRGGATEAVNSARVRTRKLAQILRSPNLVEGLHDGRHDAVSMLGTPFLQPAPERRPPWRNSERLGANDGRSRSLLRPR